MFCILLAKYSTNCLFFPPDLHLQPDIQAAWSCFQNLSALHRAILFLFWGEFGSHKAQMKSIPPLQVPFISQVRTNPGWSCSLFSYIFFSGIETLLYLPLFLLLHMVPRSFQKIFPKIFFSSSSFPSASSSRFSLKDVNCLHYSYTYFILPQERYMTTVLTAHTVQEWAPKLGINFCTTFAAARFLGQQKRAVWPWKKKKKFFLNLQTVHSIHCKL